MNYSIINTQTYQIGGVVNKIMYVLVILGLMFLSVNAFAEDNELNNTHGFGVHFGNVSGNGYAYRYIGKDLGIDPFIMLRSFTIQVTYETKLG